MRLILVCTFIIIIIWQTDRSQKDGSNPHMTNGDGSIIVLTRRTNPLESEKRVESIFHKLNSSEGQRKKGKQGMDCQSIILLPFICIWDVMSDCVTYH